MTCASGVHETFPAVVQAFYKVASAYSDAFSVEHNRDIRITSDTNSRSTRVPDFAFRTNDLLPKYLLVLECAWSQSMRDADTKAWQLLERMDVKVVIVICINQKTGPLGSPNARPPPNYQIPDETQFPDARDPLANVVFGGSIWARGIKDITLRIYRREYMMKSYVRFFSLLIQILILFIGHHPWRQGVKRRSREDCDVPRQISDDRSG